MALAAVEAPRPAPIFKLARGKGVEVYAHRGVRSFAPENTLPAYQAGLRIGTHWIDCDIGCTKDGEIIVSHDLWLNPDLVRLANGQFFASSKQAFIQAVPEADLTRFLQPYLLKNSTLAELNRLDVGRLNPGAPYASFFPEQRAVDGTHMPTLRTLIRSVKGITGGQVGFQIELKTDPGHPDWTLSPHDFAEKLYKILKSEAILDQAEIQAFDWRCLLELRKLDPRIRTAFLTEAANEARDPNDPGFKDSFYQPDPQQAGLWTAGRLLRDYGYSIPQMVKAMGGTNWEPEDLELTKEALDEAHRLGLKVCTWTYPEHSGTTFDSALVQKLITWGVDGIITDDPGHLNSLLAARGFALPRRFPARDIPPEAALTLKRPKAPMKQASSGSRPWPPRPHGSGTKP